jgi:hypothetical protein
MTETPVSRSSSTDLPPLPPARLVRPPLSKDEPIDGEELRFLRYADAYQRRFGVGIMTKSETFRLLRCYLGAD